MKKLLASLAFLLIGVASASAQNYQATAGAGLTFGAHLVGGVLFPKQTLCDPTTVTQCVTVNASGQVVVGGPNAGAAAATGNPVPAGGVYRSTVPTYTDGQRAELQTGTRGSLSVQLQATDSASPISAAVPADALSNAGTGLKVNAFSVVYNGATWDRAPGTTAGAYGIIRDAAGNARGANVNASNQLAVAGPVTVASGGIASGAVASGAYASGAFASGSMVDLGSQADAVCGTPTGTCSLIALAKYNNSVSPVLGAGSALIGDVNLRQGGTALSITNPIFTNNVATATGGASTTGNIAANNTTAVVVKASAGKLMGAQLATIGAVPLYLKIYNAASATCGSGTPAKRLIIPKAGTAADGGGSNVSFGDTGVDFSTGITYCVTGGIADSDTTAPAASVALINLDWK